MPSEDTADTTDLLATAVEALGGSTRDGQVRMANAVAHAIDTGEHLAVQAGTGTGKSLAYLVPAAAHAAAKGVYDFPRDAVGGHAAIRAVLYSMMRHR